ncbi:uncharacterized protein LOC116926562 [Daphnia magna]|uniref:C-type lectin domain-containing protein n=1 Tax=Daphnia magna TaxID=35525 RepID=A0A164VKC0_9CRUS|nr:uncharacterized protein LOC116926562 [Daphnia magna]KZS12407.1 Uncharacterized protein APZ42_022532 [Daphnia magna]
MNNHIQIAFCVCMLAFVNFSYGNVAALRPNPSSFCGKQFFIEDALVIDGPFQEGCVLEFQTQDDRILAFSILRGVIDAFGDEMDTDSAILQVEHQETHELSGRQELPVTMYTKNSKASVRFLKATAHLQLKIQKAVTCELNVGVDTSCGRVVDEVSCYCQIAKLLTQVDHTMFCLDIGMKLVSFETALEEEKIRDAWFPDPQHWTSMTDYRRDNDWVWESTMSLLSEQSYTLWFPGRPNMQVDNSDDCMVYGGTFLTYWGDVSCDSLARSVCEAQP